MSAVACSPSGPSWWIELGILLFVISAVFASSSAVRSVRVSVSSLDVQHLKINRGAESIELAKDESNSVASWRFADGSTANARLIESFLQALGDELASARVVDNGAGIATEADTIRISVRTSTGVIELQVGPYHEYLRQYYVILNDQQQLLVAGRSIALANRPRIEFMAPDLLDPVSNNNLAPAAAVME